MVTAEGGGSAEDVVSSYPVTSAGPGSDVRRGGGGGGVALQQTGYQSENLKGSSNSLMSSKVSGTYKIRNLLKLTLR